MTPDQQLSVKLKLEDTFKQELRKLFHRIAVDFRVSVMRRRLIHASRYHASFSALLDNHYARVQNKFKNTVKQKFALIRKNKSEQTDEELLAIFLLGWRENRVYQIATQLTNTTQRELEVAIERANSMVDENGNMLPQDEKAGVVFRMLKKTFKRRETTIAITETNTAAEVTKLGEVSIEEGLDPDSILRGTVVATRRKIWNTIGDRKVRPSHKMADGQNRALNEPFTVKNQQLMHPGDTSLGASTNNIVNCRCYLTYN